MRATKEPREETALSGEPSFKMRELEEATGVGRETIRFYIREGLLPEPERPKRNVARYSQIHIDRLKAIKKLQQERFLPLNVIRTIMKAQDTEPAAGISSFIGLENALYPLMGDPKNLEPRRLAEIGEELGLAQEEYERLIRLGFIRVDVRDGERWVDSRNARIMALWREMRELGFTEELGYADNEWRVYAEFIDWLVREEVSTFYGNLAARMGQTEAATLAAEGVRIMNEMLPLMRTDRVVRAVAEISERGELPVGPDDQGSDS